MEPLLIKRYAGHRLCNTVTASYIPLGDLENMVLHGTIFFVRDADTGRNITRDLLDQLQ
jgi:polyhydroxyalkanoate synthesis regulator protein